MVDGYSQASAMAAARSVWWQTSKPVVDEGEASHDRAISIRQESSAFRSGIVARGRQGIHEAAVGMSDAFMGRRSDALDDDLHGSDTGMSSGMTKGVCPGG
jgi:hypothetical protein